MTTIDYILLSVVFLIFIGALVKNGFDDADYLDEVTNRYMSEEEYYKIHKEREKEAKLCLKN